MALKMLGHEAESLALRALGYIAADPDRLRAFMGTYGLDADQLKQRASDPEFLGFVLDHLVSDDDLVIGFATADGIDPEAVLPARAALPGGDTPEWT
jgi:hypothetical protein